MVALVERITRGGSVTREAVRRTAATRQKAKAVTRRSAFVYRYAAPNKSFSLRLAFRKSQVPRDQLIETLEGILQRLRGELDEAPEPTVGAGIRPERRPRVPSDPQQS